MSYAFGDVEAGRELDPPVRSALGRVVGADLSGVTVHEGPRAAAAAAARGARAFTAGQHVVLGRGDLPTLVHELTHVVQQRRSGTRVQHAPLRPDTFTGDVDEDEARLAERYLRHGRPLPYRQAMRLAPPPATPPPSPPVGEAVRDTRIRVLPGDRASVDRLRRYLVAVRTAVENALAQGQAPANARWLTILNDSVLDVLRVVDALVADIDGDRLVIRFDIGAGRVAASYDVANDLMHLRPFTTEADMRDVAASMVHEFTHLRQARATESRVAATLAPQSHGRAAELTQEVDARRHDVYFSQMAAAVQLGGSMSMSDLIFHSQFETARTAPGRARERRDHASALRFAAPYEPSAAAARDLRDAAAADRQAATIEQEGRRQGRAAEQTVEREYAAQLAAHAPRRNYPVELMTDDSVVLHRGAAGDVRLGRATARTSTTDLAGEIDRLLHAWSGYASLFRDGAQRFPVALVTVVYAGRVVTRFGIAPP